MPNRPADFRVPYFENLTGPTKKQNNIFSSRNGLNWLQFIAIGMKWRPLQLVIVKNALYSFNISEFTKFNEWKIIHL
jgi:hypothetical protein